MSDSICPYPRFRAYYPGTSNPLVGGQLYTLIPGSSGLGNLMVTFTDSTGGTPNTNPVILDSNGEADVWLSGYTKLVLYDALNNLIWSIDNVSSMPSTTFASSSATQWVLQNLTIGYISGTQFSVVGNLTLTFPPGIAVMATVNAGTIYGIVSASSYSAPNTTVTVIWNSGQQLDSGLSAISTGIITVLNNSLPVLPIVSEATSWTFYKTDYGNTFEANSATAISATLPVGSTIPSGWWVKIKNIGNGLLTVMGTVDGVVNPTLNGSVLNQLNSPNNDEITIFWDGTRFLGKVISTTGLGIVSSAIQGNFKNLKITNVGTANPNTTVSILADSVVVMNPLLSTNNFYPIMTINLSISILSSGANGLDTSTVQASNWYYIFIIYNPTAYTVAGLFSASLTPTLPSGYTYYARVGAIPTDANSHLITQTQYGRKVHVVATILTASQVAGTDSNKYSCILSHVSNNPSKPITGANYTTYWTANANAVGNAWGANQNYGTSNGLPILVSGTSGTVATPVWTAVQVQGNGYPVPPTASRITGYMIATYGSGTFYAILAPNGTYSSYGGAYATGISLNLPPVQIVVGINIPEMTGTFDFELESASIYYACGTVTASGSCVVLCSGYEDNL